jgi:hypothetical protein
VDLKNYCRQSFSQKGAIAFFCAPFLPPGIAEQSLGVKNRAFRFNLLAPGPKGFPLQSLAPHGLFWFWNELKRILTPAEYSPA